jgi:YfiH family protein
MIRATLDKHTILKFNLLSELKDLEHVVTTRQGGISRPPYESFNLSLTVDDTEGNVLINRSKLASILGVSNEALYFPDQCHSANIREVTNETLPIELKEIDSLISNTRGKCLIILTADCVPILLYDASKQAIAAIHAGWRGTIDGIVSKTIGFMSKQFSCRPSDIIACIGPCISWPNYEVGDEVAERFEDLFGMKSNVLRYNACSDKTHIDLCEANRILLLQLGVLPQNIEIGRLCTYENPGLFFSARRDGIKSGRFSSCIMLP